jgi:hypothetical protein
LRPFERAIWFQDILRITADRGSDLILAPSRLRDRATTGAEASWQVLKGKGKVQNWEGHSSSGRSCQRCGRKGSNDGLG